MKSSIFAFYVTYLTLFILSPLSLFSYEQEQNKSFILESSIESNLNANKSAASRSAGLKHYNTYDDIYNTYNSYANHKDPFYENQKHKDNYNKHGSHEKHDSYEVIHGPNYEVIIATTRTTPKTHPKTTDPIDRECHHVKPFYIDKSGLCPKLYYAAYRIVQDCSGKNLASNWPVEAIDQKFVTELLLLSNSFSSALPYMQINNYYHLRSLDLSNNSISERTSDLKLIDCDANELKEIKLNFNSFKVFPLFGLNCLKQLEIVRLRNNDISSLDGAMNTLYPQMANLKVLDLAFNSIKSLNFNQLSLLSKFSNLVYLNLRNNKIKFIQENVFLSIPKLSYLNLEGNQLQCSRDLLWFQKYLLSKFKKVKSKINHYKHGHEPQSHHNNNNNNKHDDPYPMIIHGPIQTITDDCREVSGDYYPSCLSICSQRNESILNLTESEFYTPIYLNSSVLNPNSLNIASGQAINLDCSVYSVPPADLWWSFDDKVLSKTVSPQSPYEFIENFDVNSTNKTSILRIKSGSVHLSGTYSCQAYYLNNCQKVNPQSIAKILFKLNVASNPASDDHGLSAGALAGIIIGSVLGFLLLCCLLFLCIYCCCYRRGLCCCCYGSSMSSGASSSSSSALYKNKYTSNKMTEIEEKASGFKDLNRTKPNYVINTISKSTTHLTNSGSCSSNSTPPFSNNSPPCNRRQMIPVDSSGSWRILPDCAGEDELASSKANICSSTVHQINDKNASKYDETMVYNLNKATSVAVPICSAVSSAAIDIDTNNYQNQRVCDQSHIYTIRKPIEYVSTNEAYLTETQDYNTTCTTNNNNNNNNNNLRLSNLSELNANTINNNLNSNNYYNSSINLQSNAANPNHFYAINDDYLNDESNFALANPHEKMTSSYVKHQSFRKQYNSNFETINTNPNVNINVNNNTNNNNHNNSFAKYDSDV
jgi:hypothetical protein